MFEFSAIAMVLAMIGLFVGFGSGTIYVIVIGVMCLILAIGTFIWATKAYDEYYDEYYEYYE